MSRQILKTEQKALELNLNDRVYGTFAEIGAGQEVARYFFQVGAAAGTIAKTMSAYDKIYSDAIYGQEPTGRYVSETRLQKMLDHEYGLIEERLSGVRTETNFFVFADTVQAINYQRTIKGNGWVGIRFMHYPGSKPNDVVMHVKMLDKNNRQQQEAIGILGVNLIYACYYYLEQPEEFVVSLLDDLKSRMQIDMVRVSGPAFERYDNRLLCLYLVKNALTEVSIFDPNKQSVHASEFLYRKETMIVRGHFRPPTKVTQDAFEASFKQFKTEPSADPSKCVLLAEITMDNLNRFWELDEKDFLDRTEMLCAMGHHVIISDCNNHLRLFNYLADYRVSRIGIVMGIHELYETIINKYEHNKDGNLLSAFGELFSRSITVYAYPAREKAGDAFVHLHTLDIPEEIRFLYQHLIDNRQIIEVTAYNKDLLDIIPGVIYERLEKTEEGTWEHALPENLVSIIKQTNAFKYGLSKKKASTARQAPKDAEYY